MDYIKVKSVAKQVTPKGDKLQKLVLDTMKTISSIVGATLGPGGMPVLIERFEHNMPAMITKDGVTVFRNLGFEDSAAHVIMEAARDAAVRTASEAGDGTTTATVLAEAIVRLTANYCKNNPKVSPQGIVRKLEKIFRDDIAPALKELARQTDSSSEEGKKLLRAVANISANGDTDLADAVMQCLELTGDEGNVTILEVNGPSHYEVERMEGFPIDTGYETSCRAFYSKFINIPEKQKCVMDKPIFVLYHGKINEFQVLGNILDQIGTAWKHGFTDVLNVVIVATGFSESVLGNLALNFANVNTMNIFPLAIPMTPIANGQYQFLEDLSAVTGAIIWDPMNRPLESIQPIYQSIPGELNPHQAKEFVSANLAMLFGPGVKQIEIMRYTTNILGRAEGTFQAEDGQEYDYADALADRAVEIQALVDSAESILDKKLLQERLGKITSGIAKLKVIGSSSAELREKSDRAEDAVCAVRGAIKYGCLPGGGWALLKISDILAKKYKKDSAVQDILCTALYAPTELMLINCGLDSDEIAKVLDTVTKSCQKGAPVVYNAFLGDYVDPYEDGVLDSTPAVLEAIRNSLSIASLLGTLGGTVVYKRDMEIERSEARATQDFVRNSNVDLNEADVRV